MRLGPKPALLIAVLSCAACAECGEEGTQGVDAVVVPSSDALAFGGVYVGAVAEKQLQLRALGSGSVAITSVAIDGDAAFGIGDGVGAFRIGRGNTGAIAVRFRPADVGPRTATLVVTTDVEATPELRVALSGEGFAPDDCEDHEDCTTDTFTLAAGACVHARREGACDDHNACTSGDVCVEGRCLGLARNCSDESACTRDLCDAASGCVSLADPAACDDTNPCTAESCDADGCHHTDVENGTPCGAITGCKAVPICLFGSCTKVDAPDGTPCSDGDACTTADTCRAGSCAGTREQRAPVVTATLSTFGTTSTDSLILGPTRVVFSHRLDGSGERVLTLVENRGGTLVVLDERVVPAHTLLAATAADQFALLRESTPPALVVYTITGAGHFAERGHAEVDTTIVLAAGGLDGVLLFCAHTPPLAGVQAWSLADPDHPVFASTFGACGGSFNVDAGSHRVFVGGTRIEAWDVSTPASPALAGAIDQGSGELWVGPRTAGNGLLLLHSIRDNVSRLRAFDAVTLAPLGEIPSGLGASLQIGARRAFLSGAAVPVRIFDFTTPSAPAEIPSSAVTGLFGRLVVGERLVVTGFYGGDQRVFEHGGAPFALTPRTGRAHGRLSKLVARPWGLHVVSDVASHRFDFTLPDVPQLEAGGLFQATSALVGLGATGGAPFTVQPPFWPLVDSLLGQNPFGFTATGGLWTAAADASAPLSVGTISDDLWGAVVDGHLLVNLSAFFGSRPVTLSVRDLASLVPGFPTALPPRATLEIEPNPASAGAQSRATTAYFAAAPTRPRVAIAVNHQDAAVRTYKLHLVDVSDPAHPAEVLTAQGSDAVAAIATDGQAIAVIESHEAPSFFDTDRADTTLRITRATGAAVSTQIPGGHRIAWFDGRVAYVLTPDGVTVVDTVGTPRILGTVAIPEHPVDAIVTGDRLVVVSASRLSVVSPPCPP